VAVATTSPHLVAAGLGYSLGRLGLRADAIRADARPIDANNTRFQRQRADLDVGGSYRFAVRVTGFFSLREVLDDPFIPMERVGPNPAVAQCFRKFGVTTTVGVRPTFRVGVEKPPYRGPFSTRSESIHRSRR
jgi:hypothetical protein